jgi:RNA polymerase sigma factor (sigma-70 family)
MEKAGDNHAARFRVLVLPELAYLHRMARSMVNHRQGAEDLVQDSVLRGLQYFESYRGDSFRGWMAAIMRNVHRDRDLQAASTTASDEEWINQIPDPALDPEERVLEADRTARLRDAISKLPDRFREVLVLREFGGLSYAQIAETLSVPTGTVMSRLARARDDLRKVWLVNNDGVAQ